MEVSSNYHLGHILMEGLTRKPSFLYQIDAATGEQMTKAEALSKSIQLAKCLRNLNLEPGDVLVLSGNNHININIPFNAALFNGYPISAVDPEFKYDEIKNSLKITQPKIVFCQPEAYEDYRKAVQTLELNTKIVTYGKCDSTISSFKKEYEDNNESEKDFKVAEFDVEKVYAFLVITSGTTGPVKAAAIKHKAMVAKIMRYFKLSIHNEDTNDIYLNLSPVNWISSYYTAVTIPYVSDCHLMTSNPADAGHMIDMINKYRPKASMLGPASILSLLNRIDDVDLTCFNVIMTGGSRCHPDVITKLQSRMKKDANVLNMYGLTETIGILFIPVVKPVGSCGRPNSIYTVKLVDPDTGIEIKEPYVTGEVWCKGVTFTEYYNNPDETAKCVTNDGYIKTGDLLYRDEEENYFYVGRIKELIKYRNYQITPSEVEDVIREIPAVKEVCVIGINDDVDGQIPAACVVRREGATVTAQEIKDLVSSKLSNSKELRGGVVFLSEFPLTSSGKVRKNVLLKIVKDRRITEALPPCN